MPRSLRFGYGRVSSKDQHLDDQEARLGAVCDKLYLEKVSGTTLKRPRLQEVLDRLDEGDVLVVAKLDRLARNVADLYQIVSQMKARGATLEVLDQPMDLDSFTGKIVFAVLGLLAELETNLRHERQMAGIQAAQAKGVHFGRQHALNVSDHGGTDLATSRWGRQTSRLSESPRPLGRGASEELSGRGLGQS